MITFDWELKDGYWTAVAKLDDSDMEGDGYKMLPTLEGKGISRGRNRAIAFALEDLSKQLWETL